MRFGSRTLWEGLDFRCEPGTLSAVVGPSGSGKSTLLNCLGLLIEPTAGTISFGDVELPSLRGRRKRQFRRTHLGYLFQDYALVEEASVQENLEIALTPHVTLRSNAAKLERMNEALTVVGLAGRLRARTSVLSGGEQQRVALARLLVREPALILADEPTGALDSKNAEAVLGHLRKLASGGAVVVIATHSGQVRSACDQVIDVTAGN